MSATQRRRGSSGSVAAIRPAHGPWPWPHAPRRRPANGEEQEPDEQQEEQRAEPGESAGHDNGGTSRRGVGGEPGLVADEARDDRDEGEEQEAEEAGATHGGDLSVWARISGRC